VEVIGRQAFRTATENMCGCVHFPSERRALALTALLEPIMVLVMGSIVLLIVLAKQRRGRAYRRGD